MKSSKRLVKAILTILLASVLLAESLLPNGVGLSQDFKLGQVISHYTEHQQEATEPFSFLDFLWLHYAADSAHKHQQQHENLPCLDSHHLAVALTIPAVLDNSFDPQKLAAGFASEVVSRYQISYDFLHAADFLNPPQLG